MATHTGSEGQVKLSSNAIAEIVSFSVSSSANIVDDSAIGDVWNTHLVGMKSWTANVTCHWDETDTNGQEAATIGASVTLNLYPEGSTTGDKYYTGTATINSIEVNVSGNDAIISRTFGLTGNGALTVSTAA